MEKDKSAEPVTSSLNKLHFNQNINSPAIFISLHPSRVLTAQKKPPTLVRLCLEIVGKNLEDIIPDLGEIALIFPADIKIALVAIARRRKLLTDNVIVSLADSSWEVLDICGSDVSDTGLAKVSEICKFLRAVDISCCSKITSVGVFELVQQCRSLETLRCGGCPRSEFTARRCLSIFKPKLIDWEGESWEELETSEISHGPQPLRWLVWPKIDKESMEKVSAECPSITVNPKPSLFDFRGISVPKEALADVALDYPFIKDMDPRTWSTSGFVPRALPSSSSSSNELSIAEKFRLAFVERDTRLAPKRAKNARQHQRRAEREFFATSIKGKAIAFASKASKSLHSWD